LWLFDERCCSRFTSAQNGTNFSRLTASQWAVVGPSLQSLPSLLQSVLMLPRARSCSHNRGTGKRTSGYLARQRGANQVVTPQMMCAATVEYRGGVPRRRQLVTGARQKAKIRRLPMAKGREKTPHALLLRENTATALRQAGQKAYTLTSVTMASLVSHMNSLRCVISGARRKAGQPCRTR